MTTILPATLHLYQVRVLGYSLLRLNYPRLIFFRKEKYHFGNILFVNYLPRPLRDKLAPHVRVYSKRDMQKLFEGLPVKLIENTVIFGAYDNIIARFGAFGKILSGILQWLEKTPLKVFGLSHFWAAEKI